MSKIELLLFLIVFTTYSFFVQYPNVNQNTRFDLMRAIVHDRTVSIDRYHENTVDKSFFNGHWYADKAPGLSFVAMPAYLMLLALQPVNTADVWLGYPMYVVNTVAVALPSALLVLLVFRWVRAVTKNEHTALAVAVVFGLGTLALPFATLFFGHMTSAFFSFAAFYTLWRLNPQSAVFLSTQKRVSSTPAQESISLFAAGLIVGLASLIEYPNALVAGLLALYALVNLNDKKRIVLYVLGLLPPILLFMAYNTAAFGGPINLSYFYSPTVQSLGLTQSRLPTLVGFWHISIGPRGLFLLSPVLLLTFPGLLAMYRRTDLRRELRLFAAIIAGFAMLACLYYDQLGGVAGPRYLIPCLPFAAASIGFTLPRWKHPFTILALVSTGLMIMVTAANPMAPMHMLNPLPDYWLPAILKRHVVPTTVYLRFGLRSAASLVLLAVVLSVGVAGWLAWLKSDQQRWRAVLNVCLLLAAILYIVLGLGIDIRHPFTIPAAVIGVTP